MAYGRFCWICNRAAGEHYVDGPICDTCYEERHCPHGGHLSQDSPGVFAISPMKEMRACPYCLAKEYVRHCNEHGIGRRDVEVLWATTYRPIVTPMWHALYDDKWRGWGSIRTPDWVIRTWFTVLGCGACDEGRDATARHLLHALDMKQKPRAPRFNQAWIETRHKRLWRLLPNQVRYDWAKEFYDNHPYEWDENPDFRRHERSRGHTHGQSHKEVERAVSY